MKYAKHYTFNTSHLGIASNVSHVTSFNLVHALAVDAHVVDGHNDVCEL